MATYSKMNISEAIEGLEALKKEQIEAIESFVEAQDIFITLPVRRAMEIPTATVCYHWCLTS